MRTLAIVALAVAALGCDDVPKVKSLPTEATTQTGIVVEETVGIVPVNINEKPLRVICDTTRGNLIYMVTEGNHIAMAVVPGGCEKRH